MLFDIERFLDKITAEIYEQEKSIGLYSEYILKNHPSEEIRINIKRRVKKKVKKAIEENFGVIGFDLDCRYYDAKQKELFLRWYLELEYDEAVNIKRNDVTVNPKNNRKILYNISKCRLEDDYWGFAKACIEHGTSVLGKKTMITFKDADAVEYQCIEYLKKNKTNPVECYRTILENIRNAYDVFLEEQDKIGCYMMSGIVSSWMFFWYRHILRTTNDIHAWNRMLDEFEATNIRRVSQIDSEKAKKHCEYNIFDDYALAVLITAQRSELKIKQQVLEEIHSRWSESRDTIPSTHMIWRMDPDSVSIQTRKRLVLEEKKEKTNRFITNCEKLKQAFGYLVENQYLYYGEWNLLTEKIFYEAVYFTEATEQENGKHRFSTIIRRILEGKYTELDFLHSDLFYLREWMVKAAYEIEGNKSSYEECYQIKKALFEYEEDIIQSVDEEKGVNPYKMLIQYRDAIAYVPEILL